MRILQRLALKLPRKNRKMERKEIIRKCRDTKKELTAKSFFSQALGI